jgi:hypothetical protein
MGGEFRKKGVQVALGPVVGPLGRTTTGGRNWEGECQEVESGDIRIANILKVPPTIPTSVVRSPPQPSKEHKSKVLSQVSRYVIHRSSHWNALILNLKLSIALHRQRARALPQPYHKLR